jgi:hypothetical protein
MLSDIICRPNSLYGSDRSNSRSGLLTASGCSERCRNGKADAHEGSMHH